MTRSPKLSIKISEAAIQGAILEYLKLKGIFAWKASSTGIWDPKRGIMRTNAQTRGVADIIGIVRRMEPACYFGGIFLAIEVKSAKGKLSPAQESFRDAVQNAGGLWILARSLDDVIKVLDK